jgi:hypothetical protein
VIKLSTKQNEEKKIASKDEINTMYKGEGAGFCNDSEAGKDIIMKFPSEMLNSAMFTAKTPALKCNMLTLP